MQGRWFIIKFPNRGRICIGQSSLWGLSSNPSSVPRLKNLKEYVKIYFIKNNNEKEQNMTIDFHVHGKITSKYPFNIEQFLLAINEAKENGLDAIALTQKNHQS